MLVIHEGVNCGFGLTCVFSLLWCGFGLVEFVVFVLETSCALSGRPCWFICQQGAVEFCQKCCGGSWLVILSVLSVAKGLGGVGDGF